MRAGQPIATFSGSKPSRRIDWFGRLAMQTAVLTGKPVTFLAAVAVVALWALTGPIFHYSDTWQLVINTGTTIVTFLMVFLIQATQNRDTLALQIKLSELILALEGARNELAAVEQQPEGALENIADEIHQRAAVPNEVPQSQVINQLDGERPCGAPLAPTGRRGRRLKQSG